jgi:hypothetical protein
MKVSNWALDEKIVFSLTSTPGALSKNSLRLLSQDEATRQRITLKKAFIIVLIGI